MHEVTVKTQVTSYKFPDITPSDHTQRHPLEGNKWYIDTAPLRTRVVSHLVTLLLIFPTKLFPLSDTHCEFLNGFFYRPFSPPDVRKIFTTSRS
jgi:hypothetical protein